MQKRRYVVHVDMDAFFAAIEQRDNATYRSKPVIVGADPKNGKGRGVVSTCSYEARRFGVHSAMPISLAYKKCPHAIFLPVDMHRYSEESYRIYEILNSFSPDIEPVSIDEAFLDITGSFHLFKPRDGSAPTPLKTCMLIKSMISGSTGLTASVGLAPTMMAAKIASDLKKPDGLVEVTDDNLLDFLRPLEIRRLWGLGPKAEAAFHAMGIYTVGELARKNEAQIEQAFGKNGRHLWLLANGIDERRVTRRQDAQSISNEMTFDKDTLDPSRINGALMSLCESVSARLRNAHARCKTVTLKIRLSGFLTYTRSITLERPTNFSDLLYNRVKDLYNNFDHGGRAIRLLGVKASNIASSRHGDSLFEENFDAKRESIHSAMDRIRNKFGEGYICRATGAAKEEKD